MSLQDIFYTMGIIFMSIGMVLLLVIGVILVTIKRRVTRMYEMLDEKFSSFTSLLDDVGAGASIAGKAVRKVKEVLNK